MLSINQINECKSGGRAAFKVVYESCAPYVYSIIKRYVEKGDYHKDIMQEVFAKTFLKLKQFDPEKGEFKFWIRKITINECFKHYNHQKKNRQMNVAYKNEELEQSFESSLGHMTREDIEVLLSKMPAGYKQIFMLTVIDGFNHNEVGEMLNITPVTSRSQLSRAKNWMKKEIMSELKSLRDGTF